MQDHSTITDLLTMLESSTFKTEQVLNEDSESMISKIKSAVSTATNEIQQAAFNDLSGSNDNTLKLISMVSRINVTSDFGIINTFEHIEEFHPITRVNIQALFDNTLSEIHKHSNNPDTSFNVNNVVSNSLKAVFKQLTGKDPSGETMNMSKFQVAYKDYLFGHVTKKPLRIIKSAVIRNLKSIMLTLKFIDTKLIYQHIDSLRKFQSDLITEFNKDKYKEVAYSSSIPSYLSAIQKSIDLTSSIYVFIKNVYLTLQHEYIRILDTIKSKNDYKSKNESVSEIDQSVANYINSFTTDLYAISSRFKTVLIESGNDSNTENTSESLRSLSVRFASESNRLHSQFAAQRDHFYEIMGPLLNSLSLDSVDTEYNMRDGLNKRVDYGDELISKMDDNYSLLEDILKHYNKYTDLTIRDYITRLMPEEFISCIPFSDVNLVGVLTTNISSKICGDRKYTKPDIDAISQNVVSIPKLLGDIDSHINKLNLLISNNITIVPDYVDSQSQQMVITTIVKSCFAYLAIILSIYNNLTNIESQSIDLVTAISKSRNDDYIPM